MKANIGITTFTKEVFDCPNCGSPEFSHGHLKPGMSFGPWYCDGCGCAVRGKAQEDGVDIERTGEWKAKTLVLLRLDVPTQQDKQIHIVVQGMLFYKDGQNPEGLLFKQQGLDAYFYDEHTCPWNYLRVPIKEGDNTDPHGLFVHQETILMPEGYDGCIEVEDASGSYSNIDAWHKLFPSLAAKDKAE